MRDRLAIRVSVTLTPVCSRGCGYACRDWGERHPDPCPLYAVEVMVMHAGIGVSVTLTPDP